MNSVVSILLPDSYSRTLKETGLAFSQRLSPNLIHITGCPACVLSCKLFRVVFLHVLKYCNLTILSFIDEERGVGLCVLNGVSLFNVSLARLSLRKRHTLAHTWPKYFDTSLLLSQHDSILSIPGRIIDRELNLFFRHRLRPARSCFESPNPCGSSSRQTMVFVSCFVLPTSLRVHARSHICVLI